RDKAFGSLFPFLARACKARKSSFFREAYSPSKGPEQADQHPIAMPTPPSGVSFLHTVVCVTIGAAYSSFTLATTLLYYIQARNSVSLNKRSLTFTIVGAISNAFGVFVYMCSFAWHDAWPCYMDFIACYLGMSIAALCLAGRAVRLVLIYYLQKSISSHMTNVPKWTKWFIPPTMSAIEARLDWMLVVSLILTFCYTAVVLATFRYYGDPEGRTVAIFPIISYHCSRAPELVPFFITCGLFIYIICPIALALTWKLRDGYGIRNSLWASVGTGFPCFLLYFVWEGDIDRNYAEYWTSVVWPCITAVAIHISSVVVPLYHYNRDRFESRLPNAPQFEEVLRDPVLFAKFCRYCVTVFCAELTRFVEDYQALKVMAIESFKCQFPEHNLTPPPPPNVYSSRRHLLDSNSSMRPIPTRLHSTTTDIYSVPPPTISISKSIETFFLSSHGQGLDEESIVAVARAANLPWLSHTKSVLSSDLPVPEAIKPSFCAFYNTFMKPGGMLEVNLTSETLNEIRLKIETNAYTLDMFEDAKREVLDLLQFNVFGRFYNHLQRKLGTAVFHNESIGRDHDTIYLERVL
ncbi:hypothetical protein BC938DRAFT_474079, partial [Jimgerdemannia flammicorona]